MKGYSDWRDTVLSAVLLVCVTAMVFRVASCVEYAPPTWQETGNAGGKGWHGPTDRPW